MNKSVSKKETLFDRVVVILEDARKNVLRSVNNNMVIANWLIGREIINEVQKGKERAKYGKEVLENLSKELTDKYGRGFSTTNLRYFRTFYSVYKERDPSIRHIDCGELIKSKQHNDCAVLDNLESSLKILDSNLGFSPNLGWSHYRALMRVERREERIFYEIEADKNLWDGEILERQIHTFLFARLIKSKDKNEMMQLITEGNVIKSPSDAIKNQFILDFLGLPQFNLLHESELEKAIINNLQEFLLELGKGFAFVGRQKRMQFDDEYFYIDLVFYNCILKCYLLIDLKMGKLTYQDLGQMDGYVRMFDNKYITDGDNPTIGLILCAEENQTIAKYSVLNESKQIFASKYMLYLPTEEELKFEIEKERHLVEKILKEKRLSQKKLKKENDINNEI